MKVINLSIFVRLIAATSEENPKTSTDQRTSKTNKNECKQHSSKTDDTGLCFKTLQEIINDEFFERKVTQKDVKDTYNFFISTLETYPKDMMFLLKKTIFESIAKLIEFSNSLSENAKVSKCREDLLKIFGLLCSLKIKTLGEMVYFYKKKEAKIENVFDTFINLNQPKFISYSEMSKKKRILTAYIYDILKNNPFTARRMIFDSNAIKNLVSLINDLKYFYENRKTTNYILNT